MVIASYKKMKIIVWGSGEYYKNYKYYISSFYEILAFVHGDEKQWGNSYENKPIISPYSIEKYEFDYFVIAIERRLDLLEEYKDYIPKRKIINIKDLRSCKTEWMFEGLSINRKNIKCYFYDYPNIGDSINNFLMDILFDCKIEKSSYTDADLSGIGSILDRLLLSWGNNKNIKKIEKSEIYVWGSGFMYEHGLDDKFIRNMKFGALRGKKTRNIVSRLINNEVDCILADPGLLVSELNIYPKEKHQVGIIPHQIEIEDNQWEIIKNRYEDAILIDVRNNPLEVLKQIAGCSVIISTSLHGLIFADSFGIPNIWCEYSKKILGNRFKFYDYYSSYNINKDPWKISSDQYPSIQTILENYEINYSDVKIKQEQLKKAFILK